MPYNDCLGDRMKQYESRNQYWLQRRTPVIVRVDGKAFHTFTRGFQKPFDEVLGNAMVRTMEYLCKNIQGCVFGYTQSDEITLLLIDYQTFETDAWFDYEVQKMCSIAASMATMRFNKAFSARVHLWAKEHDIAPIAYLNEGKDEQLLKLYDTYINALTKGAMFDARVFNIPKEEVANLVYWRQLDATRNSIQMVGQSNFSHRELHGKSCNMIQDMLLTEKDINWNNFETYKKRGSCCVKSNTTCTFATENEDGTVTTGSSERPHWYIDLEIPIFKSEGREYIDKLITHCDCPCNKPIVTIN